MKKIVSAVALSIALIGCASSPTGNAIWASSDTVMVEKEAVRLESTLWIDMMPKVGETSALLKEQNLYGALYLRTDKQLPAGMDVSKVVLKQDDIVWEFEGDDFELRTQSESQWEVAFNWQLEVNITKPIDVAVQLTDSGREIWVVNGEVPVDTVY